MDLFEKPVYQPFPNYNSYVAEIVNGTVYIPSQFKHRRTRTPEFMFYVDNLLAEIRIKKVTAIISLIYCERLRKRLPKRAKGNHDTIHRIYTSALLLACKYTNETYTHKEISEATHLFSPKELNKMEFELLTLIDYNTWVTREDIRYFINDNSEGLYCTGGSP